MAFFIGFSIPFPRAVHRSFAKVKNTARIFLMPLMKLPIFLNGCRKNTHTTNKPNHQSKKNRS